MSDPYRESVEANPEGGIPDRLLGLEKEIQELEKRLAEKRAEKEKPLEQALKQEDQAAKPVAAPVTAPAVPAAVPVQEVKQHAESFKRLEKNQQIKSLVDLAFQKNVAYATEVARGLDNPYLLDEFHDVLSDEMHKELVAKKKLEEI